MSSQLNCTYRASFEALYKQMERDMTNDADFFRQAVREREGARMLQRLTLAVARSIELNLESGIALAPLLGRPAHLKNYVALEQWVACQLIAQDIYADKSALQKLSRKLYDVVSESEAA